MARESEFLTTRRSVCSFPAHQQHRWRATFWGKPVQ